MSIPAYFPGWSQNVIGVKTPPLRHEASPDLSFDPVTD